MSDERVFLFLHGVEGSGPEHWQRWLANRLEEAGMEVRFPDFPEPDAPELEPWLEGLEPELSALAGRRITVLCQSLGCALWLHRACTEPASGPAERVLLVAPPSPGARGDGRPGFFPVPLDPRAVSRAAGVTRVVCSDDDPHNPEGADSSWAAPLGVEAEVKPGAGHVTTADGFGPWPALETWCVEGRTGPVGA